MAGRRCTGPAGEDVIVLRKAKATPIEAIRRDTFERDSSGRNTQA